MLNSQEEKEGDRASEEDRVSEEREGNGQYTEGACTCGSLSRSFLVYTCPVCVAKSVRMVARLGAQGDLFNG